MYKKSTYKKPLVDGEAISIVDIKREMVFQKNLLYTETTRGLVKKDPRWQEFFGIVAGYLADKIRSKVVSKVSTVNQIENKQRFPNCGMCEFWKLPPNAKNPDTVFRACTNPFTFRNVYAFNPHSEPDKETILKKVEAQIFFTHKHQSCKNGIRKYKVKGV